MELEITWSRALRIWWAFLWRNLIAIVGAVFLGALIGGILGAIMGAAGASAHTIRTVTTLIGGIVGLGISVIPIKLILGRSYGEFRLVLLSTSSGTPQNVPADTPATRVDG